MQSGLGKSDKWLIRFETNDSGLNPLMGWESSSDTLSELNLEFSTKELAIEYAKKNKIDFEIIEPQKRKTVKKSYADNFLKIKLMFKFFTQRKWQLWSWIGSFVILLSLWIQVQIDVKINEWFGQFYDMIQKALAAPNSITIEEYWASLLSFITLAGIYVALATIVAFFTAHYLFRWRTAMVEWYHGYMIKLEL